MEKLKFTVPDLQQIMGMERLEFTVRDLQKVMGMERLTFTVPDLQQVLGIGRRQAYDLVNRADFPVIRLGRRILIPRDALIRWIDAQTTNALEGGAGHV